MISTLRPADATGRRVLWTTSFDATPISGVVVQFIKVARISDRHGYRIHLDLGDDIKEDKGRCFQPYQDEAELLPAWVHLTHHGYVEHPTMSTRTSRSRRSPSASVAVRAAGAPRRSPT
jgi:hypothetical protein